MEEKVPSKGEEEEEKKGALVVWSLCPSSPHVERDSCHSEYFMRSTQCHTHILPPNIISFEYTNGLLHTRPVLGFFAMEQNLDTKKNLHYGRLLFHIYRACVLIFVCVCFAAVHQTQQEKIDSIEDNVNTAAANVEEGTKSLGKVCMCECACPDDLMRLCVCVVFGR